MINRVILVGNMTRDAEATVPSADGAGRTALTRMRVATNRAWRDAEGRRQETAEFHTVVAFGRLAEVCAQLCTRGRRVYIEGRLHTRDYDGADGLRRLTTEVVAETMQLLDRAPRDPREPVAASTDPQLAGTAPSEDGQAADPPASELATAS